MSLEWRQITSRHDAAILQQFRCTSEPPRTAGGRKLPHPKPWESEVQAFFRRMPHTLRPEDVLLVGFDAGAPMAAAAIEVGFRSPDVLDVFIQAAAVELSKRGGDHSTADATMDRIVEHTSSLLTEVVQTAVVYGKVHVQNESSQRWLTRTGFEPIGIPSGEYQQWVLRLAR